MKQVIYVALLNEGTKCWRPVEAEHQMDNVYLMTGCNLHPDDEKWKFETGKKVRCRLHIFSSGETKVTAWKQV